MARIDFLPVCSNCGKVLWDQTIDLATDDCAVGCGNEGIAFSYPKGIIPFHCSACESIFKQITMPIKLPFTAPNRPESQSLLEKIVPMEYKPSSMPSRVWATNQALVWCCNSLAAISGKYNRCNGGDPLLVQYIDRAISVIHALLDETGRTAELEQWDKELALSRIGFVRPKKRKWMNYSRRNI